MTVAVSMETRITALVWGMHSATRPGVWHLVTLDADGLLSCTCEWWRNGGGRLKDCKHAAAVRNGEPEAGRPVALWTTDEAAPTAREWLALLAAAQQQPAGVA